MVPVTAAVVGLGGLTSADAQEPRKAGIEPQQRSVKIGKRVLMKGRFPDAANAQVNVRFKPAGARHYRQVASTRTGGRGGYGVKVKPRGTGLWRAELAEPARYTLPAGPLGTARPVDARTDAERIRVRSKTRAKVKGKHAKVGQAVKIVGRVAPRGRRPVEVRVGGREIDTKTNRRGRFKVRWKASSTGTRKVVVKAKGDKVAAGSKDKAGKVTVYRPAIASWYGPGLYGNGVACGGTLTPSTIGVAHKTLPCGTKLRLKYGNRTVAVRVIDRGPYSGNREFDLTYATKQRLGFNSGVGTVWSSK